jgi:hypothetical protein
MRLVAAAGSQALLLAVLAEEACGAQQSHKDSKGELSIDGPS